MLESRGVPFIRRRPTPTTRRSTARCPNHGEPIARLRDHGMLIDGEGVVEGRETQVLLQIFTRT